MFDAVLPEWDPRLFTKIEVPYVSVQVSSTSVDRQSAKVPVPVDVNSSTERSEDKAEVEHSGEVPPTPDDELAEYEVPESQDESGHTPEKDKEGDSEMKYGTEQTLAKEQVGDSEMKEGDSELKEGDPKGVKVGTDTQSGMKNFEETPTEMSLLLSSSWVGVPSNVPATTSEVERQTAKENAERLKEVEDEKLKGSSHPVEPVGEILNWEPIPEKPCERSDKLKQPPGKVPNDESPRLESVPEIRPERASMPAPVGVVLTRGEPPRKVTAEDAGGDHKPAHVPTGGRPDHVPDGESRRRSTSRPPTTSNDLQRLAHHRRRSRIRIGQTVISPRHRTKGIRHISERVILMIEVEAILARKPLREAVR